MANDDQKKRLSKTVAPRLNPEPLIVGDEPRTSPEVLTEVRRLLHEYKGEVLRRDLSAGSRDTYCNNAEYFVRWMAGGFAPGSAGRRPRNPGRSPSPFH